MTRSAAATAAAPEPAPRRTTEYSVHDGAAIPSPDDDRRAVVMPGVGGLDLSTARLHLAPVAEEDLDELFALHADPRAFSEDATTPLTEAAQMRWVLARWRESWDRHGLGYLTLRARRSTAADEDESAARAHGTGAVLPTGLLGVVGLTPVSEESVAVLSAYWRLAPAVTGRGVAREAMCAVLEHPRLGARGEEIVAVTAAGNAASRALAARLGFVPAPSARPVPGGREGDVLLVRPGGRPPARPYTRTP